ncbi:FAD dependent oxidoreductase [Sporodiniella umbellata]|nr:FAD dependent oxidoreductase [Sporodiniella umbellata]
MEYTAPSPGSKIIIVGGGCFGLSSAYALSLKGQYEICVYDRQPIPSPDAASTDINKIVRMDYSKNTLYMHLAIESIFLWLEWNRERTECNQDLLFHQVGVLLFGREELSASEKASLRAIREAGYGHFIEEFKNSQEILDRFPQFRSAVENGFQTAYLNKQGGWCNSAEAVKHVYQKCIENGVQFYLGEQGALDRLLFDPRETQSVVGVQTVDGTEHYGDLVLLTTGSWTAGLVDMHHQVIASGQEVIHFKPPSHLKKAWENIPVWCGDLSNTGYYGFPVNSEGKMKVGKHHCGYLNPRDGDKISVPRTQLTNVQDTIPVGALRQFREFLGKFLPETSSIDISYARMCWYSDSIDGHFVICPHPDYKNLIVATGDSGHAMKFLPVIGFKIRDVIENVQTDYTRAWQWRNLEAQNTALDNLRAATVIQRVILEEKDNCDAKMCSQDEFKVAKAHL